MDNTNRDMVLQITEALQQRPFRSNAFYEKIVEPSAEGYLNTLPEKVVGELKVAPLHIVDIGSSFRASTSTLYRDNVLPPEMRRVRLILRGETDGGLFAEYGYVHHDNGGIRGFYTSLFAPFMAHAFIYRFASTEAIAVSLWRWGYDQNGAPHNDERFDGEIGLMPDDVKSGFSAYLAALVVQFAPDGMTEEAQA